MAERTYPEKVTTGEEPAGAAKKSASRRWRLRASVIGLALIAALVAWLATRGDRGEEDPSPPSELGSRIVSKDELKEASASLGQPIYWAGPIAGAELELEELGEGAGARVRYVPQGSESGEASPEVLTIGSYPLADPASAVKGYGERPGGVVKHGPYGQEVATDAKRPTSVYFAGAEGSVQVEVYDPSAPKAMRLALSGKVVPAE